MRGRFLLALVAGLICLTAVPAFAGEFVQTSDVVSPYQGTTPLPSRRPSYSAAPSSADFERAIAAGETQDAIVVIDSDGTTATATAMPTTGFRRSGCGPCGGLGPCGKGRCGTASACADCPYAGGACGKVVGQSLYRKSCGYAGISVQAYPGLGVGVEFGKVFKWSRCITWSWEVNLAYQDMTDGFNGIDGGQSGKWNSARLGVKASFFPRKRWHPVVRAGVGWAIVTGDTLNDLDVGDIKRPEGKGTNFFGGYVGVGLEVDVYFFGQSWTTGPEVFFFGGAGDQGSDSSALTGTIAWHLLLNF